ncbi:MAG: PSD1 and planctomycete cytochrome C domain-containing protein [Bythopirellula sp.]
MRIVSFIIVVAILPQIAARSTENRPIQDISFSRDVQPILAENCCKCHGFDKGARQADLRLDERTSATAARDNIRAIVPGLAESSEMIRRIDSDDPDALMPPPSSGKQLTQEQRETLRRWIDLGAEYEPHWSFVQPKRTQPPASTSATHPIDQFIQARLSEANLEPAPVAPTSVLIRRASLDLTGLPPTLEEVDALENAVGKDETSAWRNLVDRLLSSPHYGERWGRWWLDQARYADSNGYSVDAPRSIWKYRDWVIRALNNNMPFDQFTIEQLAGDLLPDASVSQQVATGFHRNTPINQEGGIDKEQFRIDSVFDRVATTGSVWLGLTIGCAQCHDHKFDPIEQQEFYKLFAFFNDQDEPTLKIFASDSDEARLTAEQQVLKKKLQSLLQTGESELKAWEANLTDADREQLSDLVQAALAVEAKQRELADQLTLFQAGAGGGDRQFVSLYQDYQHVNQQLDDAPTTLVLRERATPRRTSVLIKGDFTRPAAEVTPGTPAVLHPWTGPADPRTRLDLAQWIVSPRNPLTARVMVNRIWQQYFGRGLVETENDFGMVGARPSHPGLLDWLACEFMDCGWNLKHMHRLIVTSHAYRQSSSVDSSALEADPQNRLLGRQSRLRLDAEIVRDVALVASGLLHPKLGGEPVFPPIPKGVMDQGQVKREWTESTGEDRYRRGLYTFFYRATPPPSLSVFDAPDGLSSCTRRSRSNTPLQSLALLNDTAFFEFAEALAKIVQQQGVQAAFRRCTSRRPDTEELALLQQLDSLTAARTLLNLDETITRE